MKGLKGDPNWSEFRLKRHRVATRFRNWLNVRFHRELIIEINFGGLGDNLFYSHLPRIAKEHGGCERVFISNYSEFKSPEYEEVLWKRNPYVDGSTTRKGFKRFEVKATPETNLLDEIMFEAGFDDGKRWHEPELFGEFPVREEFKGLVVFDPNYKTNAGDALTSEMVENYFRENDIHIDAQLKPQWKSRPVQKVTNLVETTSLIEFCRLIRSVRHLYCFTTGTATLAAALGKPCTVFWGKGFDTTYQHSKLHRFVCLDQ